LFGRRFLALFTRRPARTSAYLAASAADVEINAMGAACGVSAGNSGGIRTTTLVP
jgi:hypothetical protein